MKIGLVVAILTMCAAGCLSSSAIGHINRVGQATMVAGLAADWCGTRSAARRNWAHTNGEVGLARTMIGNRPAASHVDAYFALSTVLLLGAAQAVPERWRYIAYLVVGSVETRAIVLNTSTTDMNCL